MSVHIVYDADDLPIGALGAQKTKIAIIDVSDAGEVGYRFGHGPEDLCNLPVTFKSLMMVDLYGLGLFDVWKEMIFPDDENLLVIFSAPHFYDRNNPYDLSLDEYMREEKSFGHANVRKRPAALVKWLRKEGYKEIWFLVTKTPTTLHESIKAAAK